MARRKKGLEINGWLNFYKPYEMTSTRAVAIIKRLFNPKKVGHGGTLDPLTSGVLPIALGEATKTIPYCQDHLKTYEFTITWGEFRTTDDAEGEVISTSEVRPTQKDIENILPQFTGNIEQTPPQFSAIKINGQRAYDLAREGKTVEIKSRPTFIKSLKIIDINDNTVTLECISGKGTYMRSLARDIPVSLGAAGYMSALERITVGPFTKANAISLEKLEEMAHSAALDEGLLPVETVLDDIPALALERQEAVQLRNGQKLTFLTRPQVERLQDAGLKDESSKNKEKIALAVCQNQAVAIIEVEGVEVRPRKVFNL